MSKQEIIKALGAAADRVLKKSVDTGAIEASLEAAIAELQKAKAGVVSGLVDYDVLYKHMYGCRLTLESIYNGYPMVPAEKSATQKAEFEKVWGGGTKKEMSPEDFVTHAISELEKAATEPKDAAAKRVGAIKAALLMWEDLPEGQSLLPVTVVDNQKAGAQTDTIDATKAGASAFAKSLERITDIAKTEAPAPAPAPARKAKQVFWEPDMAPRRSYRGKR